MDKKKLKDQVYCKIEKFVDLIDLNFDSVVMNARASVINALNELYRTLINEIEKGEMKDNV